MLLQVSTAVASPFAYLPVSAANCIRPVSRWTASAASESTTDLAAKVTAVLMGSCMDYRFIIASRISARSITAIAGAREVERRLRSVSTRSESACSSDRTPQ